MNEVWKDICEWEEFYQVSDYGRVKSKPRGKLIHLKQGSFVRKFPGKILSVSPGYYGYPQCTLTDGKKREQCQVHLLVAKVFLGLKPSEGFVIDHKDNNRLNCHVDNLQKISVRINTSKDKKGGTSEFTGVSWHKTRSKWVCHISAEGGKVYLGTYEGEREASVMYLKALNKLLSDEKYYKEGISHLSHKEKREYLIN